ncbi:H-NS histone family protein [Cupriavidus pauculus]|uniref:DNA-binding protein n=1 Tax=Cupriavidus pauculus TaxID=82633 RepID=A0A2N5CDU6_9BURK|nr:H-NS family nucleoid-associated regulatory protein [Cupriavidus pauculus]PLQ00386.1 DNA-binding protein [Cupriavidus pauculus]
MYPLHEQNLPGNAEASETQRLRERASAIVWVRTEMAKHGISAGDLLAAGCFETSTEPGSSSTQNPALYRDAEGHTWNGNGNLPAWLQRAVNAGQSAEHFKVS